MGKGASWIAPSLYRDWLVALGADSSNWLIIFELSERHQDWARVVREARQVQSVEVLPESADVVHEA